MQLQLMLLLGCCKCCSGQFRLGVCHLVQSVILPVFVLSEMCHMVIFMLFDMMTYGAFTFFSATSVVLRWFSYSRTGTAKGGNTTNLFYHLKQQHATERSQAMKTCEEKTEAAGGRFR